MDQKSGEKFFSKEEKRSGSFVFFLASMGLLVSMALYFFFISFFILLIVDGPLG